MGTASPVRTQTVVMEEPSDLALWKRSAGGDREAFGALFDRYARTIYNFCFRRTGRWDLAEDLVSAVFLTAWRRRQEVRPTAESLLPWLYGVAVNEVRNASRSGRRRRLALRLVGPPMEVPDPADDVAARLDDERRMGSILATVRSLPRDRKSTRLNSSHLNESRMPSSA